MGRHAIKAATVVVEEINARRVPGKDEKRG